MFNTKAANSIITKAYIYSLLSLMKSDHDLETCFPSPLLHDDWLIGAWTIWYLIIWRRNMWPKDNNTDNLAPRKEVED